MPPENAFYYKAAYAAAAIIYLAYAASLFIRGRRYRERIARTSSGDMTPRS